MNEAATPEQDSRLGAHDVSTEHATCVLSDGLKCDISTGGIELLADMPEAYGGSGSAPNPGVSVRAGMASCLAILVKMTADQMDLGLRRVEVDLEMFHCQCLLY